MIGALFILSGCSINKVKYDKEEIIRSPNGKYTITLKYDNVSRPYIFKDNKIIFSYDGPGFNETAYWDVEWLSEDKLLLYLKSPQKENIIMKNIILVLIK